LHVYNEDKCSSCISMSQVHTFILHRALVLINTHGNESNGPRNNARANGVSVLTGRRKWCNRSFVMSYPNVIKFTVKLAFMQQRPHSKFERNPFSSSRNMSEQNFIKFYSLLLFAHCAKLQMHALIWLKFETCIEDLNFNTSIKFGISLINIQGVISNFTHETNLNFCYAYRVNHFKE